MRRISMTVAGLLALAAPALAQAGTVQVDLSGLRGGGTLYVQVQTRAQFLGDERVGGRMVQAPAAGALSLDLGDVPPGDYAISVWHDQNGNNRFEIDPSTGSSPDGWAMPNGDAIRAQPAFDQVKLSIPATGLRVPLEVRYYP